jgi:hypothetical protein
MYQQKKFCRENFVKTAAFLLILSWSEEEISFPADWRKQQQKNSNEEDKQIILLTASYA